MRQEEVLQSISEIRKKKRGARWYVFRCLYLIALVLVALLKGSKALDKIAVQW